MLKLISGFIFFGILTFTNLSLGMENKVEEQDLTTRVNELEARVSELENNLALTYQGSLVIAKEFKEFVHTFNESEENTENQQTLNPNQNLTAPSQTNTTKSFLESIDSYINIGIFGCLCTYVGFIIYKFLTKKHKNKINASNDLETYNNHFQKDINIAKKS